MLNKYIYYPIILIISFVLSFYSANPASYPLSYIIRPILFFTLLFALIWLPLTLFFKSKALSSLLTGYCIFFTFSFIHINRFIENYLVKVGILSNPQNKIPTIILLLFFICISFWLIYKRKILSNYQLSKNITIFTILFLLTTVSKIIYSKIIIENNFNKNSNREIVSLKTNEKNVKIKLPKNPPNIYYIILDAYARNDVLLELFNYDNSEFTKKLEKLGFRIFSDSRSNYPHTVFSVASSMNFSFLKTKKHKDAKIINELVSESSEPDFNYFVLLKNALIKLINDNPRIVKALKSIGYKHIVINSDCEFTLPVKPDKFLYSYLNLNYFERVFIDTTFLFYFKDNILNIQRAKQINYSFEMLSKISKSNDLQFVFSHIVCPHWPFTFNQNGVLEKPVELGKSKSDGTYKDNYIEQIKYINLKTIDVIESIFKNSTIKPIIIIQADHGSDYKCYSKDVPKKQRYKERFSILNAIYYPSNESIDSLPENFSPVNTFRFILNNTFGANLELLSNDSFLAAPGSRILQHKIEF